MHGPRQLFRRVAAALPGMENTVETTQERDSTSGLSRLFRHTVIFISNARRSPAPAPLLTAPASSLSSDGGQTDRDTGAARRRRLLLLNGVPFSLARTIERW